MYLFMYLTPVCITLFTEDDKLHNLMLEIACFPAVILFFIETVQMREQGI